MILKEKKTLVLKEKYLKRKYCENVQVFYAKMSQIMFKYSFVSEHFLFVFSSLFGFKNNINFQCPALPT